MAQHGESHDGDGDETDHGTRDRCRGAAAEGPESPRTRMNSPTVPAVLPVGDCVIGKPMDRLSNPDASVKVKGWSRFYRVVPSSSANR